MLLPRLEQFNPDLIFISAGFDAHYDDMYHFLTEQDLHWVTEQLCNVAERSGGGEGCGVISVLEGGYSLSSPIVTKPVKTSRSAASLSALAGTASATPSATAVGADVSAATVGAAAGLGRGGRLKAKKDKDLPSSLVPSPALAPGAGVGVSDVAQSPDSSVPVHAPITVLSTVPTTAIATATAIVGVKEELANGNMHWKYAQKPGDGGLVKGYVTRWNNFC